MSNTSKIGHNTSGTSGSRRKHEGDFSKFIKKEAPKARKPKVEKEKVVKAKSRPAPAADTTLKFNIDGSMRLNKYIAHSGVCSRRDADTLIQNGEIKVNGEVVTELGYKVLRSDKVSWKGKKLQAEKLQYVLLNKPKDFVTTTEDPLERRTVMELVAKACPERIYPVGRLDRPTTGLLLFTNDGDLAKKLTHPKHRVLKIYHVVLNKPLEKNDMLRIIEGFELEDGKINVDKLSYVEDVESRMEVGIQLHSGRNRIVRRIFEHLGYDVVRLDRVAFGGLTKKDLPRGHWRHLTLREIEFLKMI
jgi:23S rRNA pseudouridine2605 synthase